MNFRNRETGEIINETDLRRLNPSTSFPLHLTADIIDQFGYDPIFDGPQPNVTPPYEYVQPNGIVEIEGKWYTNYIVGPVFEEYVDDQGVTHTIDEQRQQYCLELDANQASFVREQRNKLLVASDWTQLADSPFDAAIKAAWVSYREALRQIPQQASFPWDIQWPTKPGEN